MTRERKLGYIIAYYLSRFDKEALYHLGYKTKKEAFRKTAEALGLVPNYIKFRRDEFDVVHPHRAGWHKVPLSQGVINTINALQHLDEQTLRDIVLDIILRGSNTEVSEELDQLILILPDEKKKKKKRTYVPRGLTGRKAEELFMEWYENNTDLFPGGQNLTDMRDAGCGYDFGLAVSDKRRYAIEVKGFSGEDGGIMFTAREWETAKAMGEDYFLVVVSNVNNQPLVTILNNPSGVLMPKKNIQTVVQVNWMVSLNKIREIITL